MKKHGLVGRKEGVIFFFTLELLKRYSTFQGTGRKNPQFDHKLWNIHDRIVANLTRSNNSIEDWHNALANQVAIKYPNIVKSTQKIRCQQSKFEVDMVEVVQGHGINTKKTCYRRLDKCIARLITSFNSSQLDQFLTSMAANITL